MMKKGGIGFDQNKTASQKAADVKARLGKSMNGGKPGYKPPATAKIRPTKNGAKVTVKF
jgi:hypothetical protein